MHFKWDILPIDDHNQVIFPKIRAFFPNFRKRAGKAPPPLPNDIKSMAYFLSIHSLNDGLE